MSMESVWFNDPNKIRHAKASTDRRLRPVVYKEGMSPRRTYYPRTVNTELQHYLNTARLSKIILRNGTEKGLTLPKKLSGELAFNEEELSKLETEVKKIISILEEKILVIRSIRDLNTRDYSGSNL